MYHSKIIYLRNNKKILQRSNCLSDRVVYACVRPLRGRHSPEARMCVYTI